MKPSNISLEKTARRAVGVVRHHRMRRVAGVAIVASAVLVTLPVASATSAALVTGRQIKDESVTGRDIRNDSISAREFGRLSAGPSGVQGPDGPQGQQGLKGAAGTSGWVTIISDGVSVAAGGTASPVVKCPAGVAVGGGAGVSVPSFASLIESAPLDLAGTGWVVTVTNGSQGPLTVFAWATCVTL
jgi:hypothetical protein